MVLRSFFPVAVALVASSCARPPVVPRDAEARALVERFFGAVPAGDCGELAAMLTPDQGPRCRELVGEMNRHELRLVEVLDTRADGRDDTAVLVRVRVSQGGEPQAAPMLFRVEVRSGHARLRL